MSSLLLRRLLAATLVPLATLAAVAADQPARLRRADSFLGIHFDFHAGPDCTEVGKNTTPAMIERIIDLVHPDYLQIDCKGHPGYSSYPTKVGQPVPGFVGDPLRVWREVTARRGVALYMHYSGVWDGQALKKPGWAALNADGKPNARATSFWGPYSDQLLIPQLRELAGIYGVDGVWVDGDSWAAVPDYSPAAIAAFTQATGFTTVPRKAGEPHWFEFLQVHREAFRGYVRHYIAEVKKIHPAFQICSNWAFTDHMPEKVSVPLDFLSGDYSPDDSVNSARLSGRYLVRQGVPWDLMAWSFSRKAAEKPNAKVQKTAVQLQREAAVVLALGGGFQAYYKQKRDGSIYDEEMPVMAEVAKFCRARQAISHHAMPVPQIALLLSTEDQYRRNNGLFNRNLTRVRGALLPLLETQYSVEIVGEHQITGRMKDYPLIIVPECDVLAPKFRDELATYVRGGGRLLLVGGVSAQLFAGELGLKLEGDSKSNAPMGLSFANQEAKLTARWHSAKLPASARAIGQLLPSKPPGAPAIPAASLSNVGRGQIGAIYFTAGQVYAKDQPALVRELVRTLVHELFPRPMVEVSGSPDVDLVVARNRGDVLVHLINVSGPHATQPILESIAPLGPLQIRVRTPRNPAAVRLEPGGRSLAYTYRDGAIELIVPSVPIHEIIAVTP